MRLRTIGATVAHFSSDKTKYQEKTYCQNVSGSPSRRHSGPNPNLYDDTDHFARYPMSGHGRTGGRRPSLGSRRFVNFELKISTTLQNAKDNIEMLVQPEYANQTDSLPVRSGDPSVGMTAPSPVSLTTVGYTLGARRAAISATSSSFNWIRVRVWVRDATRRDENLLRLVQLAQSRRGSSCPTFRCHCVVAAIGLDNVSRE